MENYENQFSFEGGNDINNLCMSYEDHKSQSSNCNCKYDEVSSKISNNSKLYTDKYIKNNKINTSNENSLNNYQVNDLYEEYKQASISSRSNSNHIVENNQNVDNQNSNNDHISNEQSTFKDGISTISRSRFDSKSEFNVVSLLKKNQVIDINSYKKGYVTILEIEKQDANFKTKLFSLKKVEDFESIFSFMQLFSVAFENQYGQIRGKFPKNKNKIFQRIFCPSNENFNEEEFELSYCNDFLNETEVNINIENYKEVNVLNIHNYYNEVKSNPSIAHVFVLSYFFASVDESFVDDDEKKIEKEILSKFENEYEKTVETYLGLAKFFKQIRNYNTSGKYYLKSAKIDHKNNFIIDDLILI